MGAPKVATFDCYGTLLDWEGGAGAFLYDLARRCGEEHPEPGQVLRERWEELQFESLSGPYRPYRDVLADSLRAWCGERGYRWNEHEGPAFERAMQSWQPFADVVPSLRRARAAGMRLGIVSNTDRTIMEHSLITLGIEFDHVLVAEDVGAYKPDAAPFRRLLDELEIEHPRDVLHIAGGFKYDIDRAHAFGMRTAWVNRHRADPPGELHPDHDWRDLWPLAELAEDG